LNFYIVSWFGVLKLVVTLDVVREFFVAYHISRLAYRWVDFCVLCVNWTRCSAIAERPRCRVRY